MKLFILLLLLIGMHASDVHNTGRQRLWNKRNLTYALFGNPACHSQTRPAQIRRTVKEAFADWQANSCFTFRQVDASSSADINVVFTNDNNERRGNDPLSSTFSHRSFCHSRLKSKLTQFRPLLWLNQDWILFILCFVAVFRGQDIV